MHGLIGDSNEHLSWLTSVLHNMGGVYLVYMADLTLSFYACGFIHPPHHNLKSVNKAMACEKTRLVGATCPLYKNLHHRK